MRGRLLILCVMLLAVGSAAARAQQILPPAYTRYTLPNGMVVILNTDHAAPLVAVNIAYHVGAKDDPPRQAGITHLCEHGLSLGSPNLNQP